MSRPSRKASQEQAPKRLTALKEELQGRSTLDLAATTFTPQTLEAYLQNRIALGNAVFTTRAAWTDAIAAYDAASQHARAVIHDLRNLVIAAFGADSPSLGTFGFFAPRRTARTSERKVAATLKAKATRKARGTMSKKQKAKLLGAPAPAAPSESPPAAAAVATSQG